MNKFKTGDRIEVISDTQTGWYLTKTTGMTGTILNKNNFGGGYDVIFDKINYPFTDDKKVSYSVATSKLKMLHECVVTLL